MIRRVNTFPTDQSSSFTEAITWSYSSQRAHAWSVSWRGFVAIGHLTRSECWSNCWTTYWKGLYWLK